MIQQIDRGNKETISALEQFQEDLDLPIGKLDYETLHALGIAIALPD